MKAFHVLILLLGLLTLAACGGGTRTGPLAAPSNLTAAPGTGEIVLTWTDNSTAEEGFRIFRKSEADAEFPTDATGQVGTDITTYTDTAISSAESYVYQVQAFAGEDSGEASNLSQPAKATQGAGKVRLTVLRAGSAKGLTTSNPNGISCTNPTGGACSLEVDAGTIITLTANPDETTNSVFAGFNGACTTTQLTCEVTMDANKDVTATYNPAQPGLTVQVSGNGRVFDRTTPDVGGPYIGCVNNEGDCAESSYWPVGSRVDLFAEAAEGYSFEDWSNNCDLNVPTTATDRCIFTLSTSTVIVATFEKIPDAPVVNFTEPTDLTYKVGTQITLRWTVQNSPLTSLTLNGEALAVGATSANITLPATGGENVYRLEARNANETPGVATKTITTGEVPELREQLQAEPIRPPTVGGSYTISFRPETETSGGVSRGTVSDYTYRLTPLGGSASTVELVETPAGSGTYVLTLPPDSVVGRYFLEASNQFGSSANTPGTGSDEFEIAAALPQVLPPTIAGFAAVPNPSPAPGTAITFSWTPGGGAPTALTLNPGNISVPLTASSYPLTPGPTADTTYTLTATNSAGSTSASTPVTVTPAPPAPTITGFTAPDLTFASGGTASFSWGFAPGGATPTSLILLQNGVAAPAACQPVSPTSTSTTCPVSDPSTSFTLQVQPGGNTTSPVVITTGAAPATTITTIDAGIVPGGYTINWTQAGTEPVSYTLTGPATATIPAIPDGATSVTITGAASSEVYTLTATNPYGASTSVLGSDVDSPTIP